MERHLIHHKQTTLLGSCKIYTDWPTVILNIFQCRVRPFSQVFYLLPNEFRKMKAFISVHPKAKLQRSTTFRWLCKNVNVGFALFVDYYITFHLQSFNQAKQNRIFTRQITQNTKTLLLRTSIT